LDNTLIQAGLASAQTIVNKALAYDPATLAKVQGLTGKVLALHFQQPDFSIFVRFENGIDLLSRNEYDADAALSGPLSAFINLARHDDKHAALMQSDIQIQGSSQLALSLADLASQLDIDYEAMLAELTGPVAAHIIGKNLRSVGSWLKNAGDKFKQDSVEFVRDELKVAPHKLEGETRFSQIHKLKLDTERLEARIQMLKQKLQ